MRVARLEPLLHGLRDRARAVRAGDRRASPSRQRRSCTAAIRRRSSAPWAPVWRPRSASTSRPGGWTRQPTRSPPAFAPGDVRLTTREQRGRPLLRPLRRPARGRARPLRAGPDGRHRGHVLRPRHLARPARVAVALLGEHGRSLAGILGAHIAEVREAFPEQLDDVSLEQFVRAANLVEPSLIRVEADEVTYNLHIFLRFELELALVRGELAVDDLPAAWNERMRTLVGIVPPDDGVRRAAGRPLVGRADRLLPDLHARQRSTRRSSSRPSSASSARSPRSCEPGSTTACSAGCASTCTAAARSSRPSRSRATRPARRSGTRRFMRYLRAKYGELYELG